MHKGDIEPVGYLRSQARLHIATELAAGEKGAREIRGFAANARLDELFARPIGKVPGPAGNHTELAGPYVQEMEWLSLAVSNAPAELPFRFDDHELERASHFAQQRHCCRCSG